MIHMGGRGGQKSPKNHPHGLWMFPYVDHFDKQDEESGIPQWKDCLFHENPFATYALQSYNKKLKKVNMARLC